MKKMVIVFWVLCLAQSAGAQTWDEWFRQKRTQINYLLEQISALKAYGAAVGKGYAVAKHGLNEIALSKEDDLNIHRQHFASLLKVKAIVGDNKVVSSILLYRTKIQTIYTACRESLFKSNPFSARERTYFLQVLDGVLNDCGGIEEQVLLLTADGTYQMNDDERLRRLQKLSEQMIDVYEFAANFKQTILLAVLNRLQDERNVNRLRSLF